MRYVVIKPYRNYNICYSFEHAKKICDEFNQDPTLKSFVLEMTDAGIEYMLKQKTYNLKTSTIVYDPFNCAPTEKEKNFYDNTIFTKPLKPQKGVRI